MKSLKTSTLAPYFTKYNNLSCTTNYLLYLFTQVHEESNKMKTLFITQTSKHNLVLACGCKIKVQYDYISSNDLAYILLYK